MNWGPDACSKFGFKFFHALSFVAAKAMASCVVKKNTLF